MTVVAATLSVGAYVPLTLLSPLDRALASVAETPLPALTVSTPVFPDYGASAVGAVGFDGVLAAGGTAAPLPIASISKLITALVVLDAKPLTGTDPGPTLTFSKADHDLYDQY